ncbi:LAETG motif-containing sortase-dependent surface protein [Actinoplanes teichomyceticus]|uniref:LPXTG-motif cell wall-anchored protein n=1 Tax=Actinoplanes teichomyceticus TaxID=1867 RepID=A0A561WNI7_ACTTI|nr:LAETG motif-containing sortase-dependent surface protein [Actinoplanes teichomyceticus]TWG25431.1 LPXTG-motif cell wall-anchored protein [Actinoplanes teichomyceticus]GIF10499.1 hypothetical protein Ate01nite_05310 [Actinoplanes teichomyceticus]
MNLFKTPFRRTGTVIAGTALGLVGVMSSAMPALACHPEIGKTTSCVNNDGTWVVNWSVTPSDNQLGEGVVSTVSYEPAAPQTISFDGIKEGDALKWRETLTATQKLEAGANVATLHVTGTWGKHMAGRDVTVNKPTTPCENQPEPSASVSSPAQPEPSGSVSTPAQPEPSASVSTPAQPEPSTSTSTSTAPSASTPASPSTTASTPSETPVVTEPQFVYDTTCDTLTVGIEVPADWKESLTVTFKPSVGDSKTVTAAPGETKTVDFEASKGLKVTATPKGYEDEAATITYRAPEGCEDEELALTGSNTSTIAGGAALVLVVGAGLFYMARRRKIRFTA